MSNLEGKRMARQPITDLGRSSALDQPAQHKSEGNLFISTLHNELNLFARALQRFSELPFADFCRRLVIKADKQIANPHSSLGSGRVVLYAHGGQCVMTRWFALPRDPRHVGFWDVRCFELLKDEPVMWIVERNAKVVQNFGADDSGNVSARESASCCIGKTDDRILERDACKAESRNASKSILRCAPYPS